MNNEEAKLFLTEHHQWRKDNFEGYQGSEFCNSIETILNYFDSGIRVNAWHPINYGSESTTYMADSCDVGYKMNATLILDNEDN